ncbi:MAG: hypothetical protein KC481_22275, partial [Acidimicrobiaceae bacterium]|nr:hypothetical protein [Acidimicrobiaceae bacterium]
CALWFWPLDKADELPKRESWLAAAGLLLGKEKPDETTAEMDSILDQVSERGMDSLTPQQRKRLEDHSKRLRRGGD